MKKWFWVLVVAGCSNTTAWEKPGVADDSMNADLSACNGAARATPSLPSPRTTSNSVEVRTAPTGVSVNAPSGAYGDADRQMEFNQRVFDCMREKGYTLKSS